MNRIRIVIADDHAVLRNGLRMLLQSQADMNVIGEAGTTADALETARTLEPKVMCLDLSMPGWGGSIIEELRSLDVRVLVYSMYDDPAYVRAALASGADGYVLKSSPPNTLLEAIRSVAGGRRGVDPAVNVEITTPADSHDLSGREKEVFELLIHGHTNQAIADQLFLSVKTIETYRARIREKTGLKSRADFIQYGIANQKRM